MMMSMSHLMDAAALHAQQQQQANSATAVSPVMAGNNVSRLPAAQSMMNTNQTKVHPNHNHTNRGPHKKRTASNASLDDSRSNTRPGAHLVNGGGVLRIPMTGHTSAVVSSAPSTVPSTINNGGKIKAPSASASNSSGTSTPTSNGPLTEEEKKAERRAANRRSAFQSRQRRKILIEDLQRTVAALSKDNNDLRKSNDEIRSQLEAALLENRQLRQITSSLSAQAHAQQAQVAAQHAQQQHQQQSAAVTQQQATGSPSVSAQQAPPPVPSISQQQQNQAVAVTPSAPLSFPVQTLNSSTAALTNFLTSFSSQAAGSAVSSEQQQHIFNAKIALMAAQSRVSELEHHQAAQVQAAANAAVAQQQQHQAQLQAQAQAAASAALGLAHVQASAPGNAAMNDAQHLARLQELLTRGMSNASAAAATPVPTAPSVATVASNNSSAPTNTTSISAAGVDLSHLRSLLEAQQQQQHQHGVGAAQVPGPISPAPTSPGRSSVHERQAAGTPVAIKGEEGSANIEGSANSVSSDTAANTVSASTVSVALPSTASAINTTSSASTVHPVNLPTTTVQEAPGLQLLIKSLRAGQNGASGNTSTPPLDEAVRNYIKQQQMAQQQQASNAATAIKTDPN